MKPIWLAMLLACGPLFPVPAQLNLPATVTTRSRSGQFVVSGSLQPSSLPILLRRAIGTNWLRLEPTLLAVSCERVKQAMLLELGAPDRWRGKCYLALRPLQSPDDPVRVVSTRSAEGWTYRLEMPDAIDPDRFVRTMVRVLLVEWANRNSPDTLLDVPSWLSEGLAEQVLANRTGELLVRPPVSQPNSLPMASDVRQERKANALAKAHEFLRAHPPLPLEQLIAPAQAELVGDAALAFRYSAQLLVCELLRLKNGAARLGAMLDGLASQPDAPTALFRAFGDHFQAPRDWEQWWALQTLHFTGRDLAQAWPLRDGLGKLDEILRAAVLTRESPNAPAARAEVPLQTLLRDWRHAWQPELVRFKVFQLRALQLRLPGELASVADEYRRVLESLLERLARAQSARNARLTYHSEAEEILRTTLKKLDALDARRETLRRKLAAPDRALGRAAP